MYSVPGCCPLLGRSVALSSARWHLLNNRGENATPLIIPIATFRRTPTEGNPLQLQLVCGTPRVKGYIGQTGDDSMDGSDGSQKKINQWLKYSITHIVCN